MQIRWETMQGQTRNFNCSYVVVSYLQTTEKCLFFTLISFFSSETNIKFIWYRIKWLKVMQKSNMIRCRVIIPVSKLFVFNVGSGFLVSKQEPSVRKQPRVEKPADTQPSTRLASHLVRAPNSRYERREFESPMRRELGALTKSGKILGVRSFYTRISGATCECDAEMVPILGVEAGPVHQVQSAANHIPSCEGWTIGLPCTTTVTFTIWKQHNVL